MMIKLAALVVFLIVFLIFYGCVSHPEPGRLSPRDVDSSMVDQVIAVKGKITQVTENPGGLGGVYLKLADNEGEVGVRIQDDIWQTFDENRKAEFRKGRTVTAEGVLFQAGKTLVVIYGKYTTSSDATSTEP